MFNHLYYTLNSFPIYSITDTEVSKTLVNGKSALNFTFKDLCIVLVKKFTAANDTSNNKHYKISLTRLEDPQSLGSFVGPIVKIVHKSLNLILKC